MGYLGTVRLAAGDYNPNLDIKLKDRNTGVPDNPATWDAIDVSAVNVEVKLLINAQGSSTVLATITCIKVDGGSTGQVYVPENSYQFEDAGVYEGDIKKYTDSKPVTVYEKVKFVVR